MINNLGITFELECDKCGFCQDTEEEDYSSAKEWGEDNGWIYRGGDNICPDCRLKV